MRFMRQILKFFYGGRITPAYESIKRSLID